MYTHSNRTITSGLTTYIDYNPPHPPPGTPAHSKDYPGANPYPTLKEQKAFEKGLLEKTAKQNTDVILCVSTVTLGEAAERLLS